MIAEGADACRMMRSIPLAKAMENSLLAYGQNGEAMRPAQGYPLRLINPGWEGNTNVKWLHSLKLTDQPYMARDETSRYSDLMPDGKAGSSPTRWSEVGHHVSVRRADAAGAGSVPTDRPGLVRTRPDRAGRDTTDGGRGSRRVAGAAAADRADAVPAGVAV